MTIFFRKPQTRSIWRLREAHSEEAGEPPGAPPNTDDRIWRDSLAQLLNLSCEYCAATKDGQFMNPTVAEKNSYPPQITQYRMVLYFIDSLPLLQNAIFDFSKCDLVV